MATYSVAERERFTNQLHTRKPPGAVKGGQLLPSPVSEGFVGEAVGRFPLGGLSDNPDSLMETRINKKTEG